MRLRRLLGLSLALSLSLAAAPADLLPTANGPVEPTPPSSDAALPDLDRIDPPRYAYEDAIVEHAMVSTRTGTPVGTGTGLSPTDTQIWVDIIRPDTAETGEAVPTILIASPYFNTLGRGWKGEGKTGSGGPVPSFGLYAPATRVPFPEWYDEYFVERGYAVALMDLRGTRNSSGCQVYGDRDEVLDTVDVIDWIADQEWSNGAVGMTGGSYDGTVAIGAAAEQPLSGRHPEALKAIIPVRAIGRWYDYHFFNGVQSSGHALTPALFTAVLAGQDNSTAAPEDDVLLPLHVAERKACIATLGAAVDAGYASPYQDATSPFWEERDFVRDASSMRAAIFPISGLVDFNVKNNNVGHLWEALEATNTSAPRKLWLMNADHADPDIPTAGDAGDHLMPFPIRDRFREWTHRWYAQFLKGLDAGALDGPEVEVQRADGTWEGDHEFPSADRDVALYVGEDGTLTTEPSTGEIVFNDGGAGSAPSSAVLTTAPFDHDTRLSGQIGFDLRGTVGGPDATIAVSVTMVPPDTTATGHGSLLHDDRAVPTERQVTYGWLRAAYRDSVPLRGISTPTRPVPTVPGEIVDLSFGSLPTDLIVPEGWRLAFRFSSSEGGTLASEVGGDVRLVTAPEGGRILLPVADSWPPKPPQAD